MAPELSSNWKRLQAQLKESKAIAEKKRKAPPTERQLNTLAKKRRLAALSSTQSLMGSASSLEAPATVEEKETKEASLALWAKENDISAKDLADAYGGSLQDMKTRGAQEDVINGGLVTDVEIGKYVGIDCEMVGVGGDEDRSVLARVSLVNFDGTLVYDSFVRPKEFVTDWRTHVSGVSAKNMATARTFEQVQIEVAAILTGRIIIGHAIRNDLEALLLSHPKKDIRDTSRFSGFRKYSAGKTPSLKKLTKEILGVCTF
jgi:RNA exonuclease 4